MVKTKVKLIKKQEKIKEVKSNIRIKEFKKEADVEKSETPKDIEFSPQESSAKSSAPVIPTETIQPVRNLDEVIEAPQQRVTAQTKNEETNIELMYAATRERDAKRYVETTPREEAERIVYNPERKESSRIVEPRNAEFTQRERPLRQTLNVGLEERRDVAWRNPNPRTEIEQLRGFYKEYEDQRKYEERGKESSKERRRRI